MDKLNSIPNTTTYGNVKRSEWVRLVANEKDNAACIIWPFAVGKGGYGNLMFDGKYANAHRVVCLIAKGEPPSKGMQAAHNCGNRLCVNPDHLEWKTCKQNDLDKIRHGTHRRGERNNLARLTYEDVKRIRAYKQENPHMTLDQMSSHLGYGRNAIWYIVTNRRWSLEGIREDELACPTKHSWQT
jgi:hypothetical protein